MSEDSGWRKLRERERERRRERCGERGRERGRERCGEKGREALLLNSPNPNLHTYS